jgi:hypothetical protein
LQNTPIVKRVFQSFAPRFSHGILPW